MSRSCPGHVPVMSRLEEAEVHLGIEQCRLRELPEYREEHRLQRQSHCMCCRRSLDIEREVGAMRQCIYVGGRHGDGEEEEGERRVRGDRAEGSWEADPKQRCAEAKQHPRAAEDLDDPRPEHVHTRRERGPPEAPSAVRRRDVLEALELRKVRDARGEVDDAEERPRGAPPPKKGRAAQRVEHGAG
eukprot:CAMPEP_0119403324 /NCGR_PEP_ID=MMETSP1334-20130426/143328_1 /TAXON_ID=127549 /ORGANISM="Calcidiscus leptoporus, Strain RCC1130" /LENGTH=186 /DNA_ID=CAMNT_0007427269 /DNA_START=398 /DNA_END=954 /DNA_ORIENTATION=+